MTVDGMSDAAKAGEAEPVAETVAWMNKNGYVVSAWWRTSEPDKYADYTTRLVKAPAPAPASPEGKRFNEATLLQIAAVRPDLLPEICAPAPASKDVIQHLHYTTGISVTEANMLVDYLNTREKALAALQSQLASGVRMSTEEWNAKCELVKQQAERIKELEAVIMVVREYPDFDSPNNAMAKLMDEALEKTGEVMG